MCTYFEAYYQYFKGGFTWLRDFHDNVLPTYKKLMAEEKQKFEQRRRKRPQGEWIPDSISGGASSVSVKSVLLLLLLLLFLLLIFIANRPSPQRTRQFATPYDDIIKRDNPPNNIPVFLEKALDYLEAKGSQYQRFPSVFQILIPPPSFSSRSSRYFPCLST